MTSPDALAITRRAGPLLRVARIGDVHLWTIPVSRSGDAERSMSVLDAAEKARARRFRFERDRRRYVLRHAFARYVLARYLGVEPAAITIRTSDHGKPELDASWRLSFNTSHTDDMTLVAVTSGPPVGVDIERLRHIDDALAVAEGLFAEREVELLRSLKPVDRSPVFLTLWTRKESLVKAIGGGLSIPFDGFDVLEADGRGLGRPRGDAGEMPFTFVQLAEPHGYVVAVTLAGTKLAVQHMDTL